MNTNASSSRQRRLLWTACGLAVVGGLGFWLGSLREIQPVAAQAQAQPPIARGSSTELPQAPAGVAGDKRVLAYVYGNVPITREEFGEYFISLYGTDERVQLFVNRRIIEMEAASRKITIPEAVVKAEVDAMRKQYPEADEKQLEAIVQRASGMSLKQFTDDIIRPKLLMNEMVRRNINVTEQDLLNIYENRFGRRMNVKAIMWKLSDAKTAFKEYEELRRSDADFDAVAKRQFNPTLAAVAGQMEPVGRHSREDIKKIEELAFTLKQGEVSELIQTPAGYMVVKVTGSIPEDKNVDYLKVKPDLERMARERKLELEVPKFFIEMRQKAAPTILAVGGREASKPPLKTPVTGDVVPAGR